MTNDRAEAVSPAGAARRFSREHVLRAVAVLASAGVFVVLLLLVEDKWGPLTAADAAARDDLHRYALTHPVFVTVMRTASDVGSAIGWQIMTGLLVIWLLWRRVWRLAVFAVVTVAGSSLLNTAMKLLVHRTRPVVSQPFVHEPGASFPSGHAQAAVVGFGVIVLLLLPVLKGAWRVVVVSAAVLAVALIGFSRVALAAHYVSDVVAGFVLGAAWLAAMTAAFSAWRARSELSAKREQGPAPATPAGRGADRLGA